MPTVQAKEKDKRLNFIYMDEFRLALPPARTGGIKPGELTSVGHVNAGEPKSQFGYNTAMERVKRGAKVRYLCFENGPITIEAIDEAVAKNAREGYVTVCDHLGRLK